MKLTTAQKKKLIGKLIHLTGECNCPPSSKTCLYWKYVDKGGEEVAREIVREIEKL